MINRFDIEYSFSPLRHDRVDELKHIFEMYDKDKSGKLDADELSVLLEALGVKLQKEDVHRILEGTDKDTDARVSFNEFLELLSLRVIECEMDASLIDTKWSLLAVVFGEAPRIEQWIFDAAVRANNIIGRMLWIMWYTGLLLGLLSQQTFVLPRNPWRMCLNLCSVLMVPLPLLSCLLFSHDLIKRLLLSGEVWSLLLLHVFWIYTAVHLLPGERCLFWLCLMPSMFVSAVSDAYPAKYRPRFQKRFFSGLLLPMVWWVLSVAFGWNDPMVFTEWSFKRLHGSCATGSVTDVCTAIMFAVKNLWSAFMQPSYFVVITSPTRTTKLHVQDSASNLVKRMTLQGTKDLTANLTRPRQEISL